MKKFILKYEFLLGILVFIIGAAGWDSLPMTCTTLFLGGTLMCYDADRRDREK